MHPTFFCFHSVNHFFISLLISPYILTYLELHYLVSKYLEIFQILSYRWFLFEFHCGQRNTLYDLSSFKFCWDLIYDPDYGLFWQCSICTWEYCVFSFLRWSALKCQVKLIKCYISLLIKFTSFLLFLEFLIFYLLSTFHSVSVTCESQKRSLPFGSFGCYVFKFTSLSFCNVLSADNTSQYIFYNSGIILGLFSIFCISLVCSIFPIPFWTYEVYLCFNIFVLYYFYWLILLISVDWLFSLWGCIFQFFCAYANFCSSGILNFMLLGTRKYMYVRLCLYRICVTWIYYIHPYIFMHTHAYIYTHRNTNIRKSQLSPPYLYFTSSQEVLC